MPGSCWCCLQLSVHRAELREAATLGSVEAGHAGCVQPSLAAVSLDLLGFFVLHKDCLLCNQQWPTLWTCWCCPDQITAGVVIASPVASKGGWAARFGVFPPRVLLYLERSGLNGGVFLLNRAFQPEEKKKKKEEHSRRKLVTVYSLQV